MKMNDLAAGALSAILILLTGFMIGRASSDNLTIQQCIKSTAVMLDIAKHTGVSDEPSHN